MLRTVFVAVFLSIYILIVGPPLLVWTLVTRKPDAIYWAGANGAMFFVRLVGVRVRVVGTERIPAETCIFAANHTSSADCDFAEKVIVSVSDRGRGVFVGWIYPGESPGARLGDGESG
jgi:hypothetical protein